MMLPKTVRIAGILALTTSLARAETPLMCNGLDNGLPFRAATAAVEDDLSDAEPVDPNEFRPQTMPPPRPVIRGADPVWVSIGPSPTRSAQVIVPPDNRVSGAVNAVAPHPTNLNILYAGSVNGGIWKTTDAQAANPTWTPQSDELPSQSITSIEFDATDSNFNTLIAGIGRLSNFAQRGDDELGVYRTTDGGTNWTLLGGSTLLGRKVLAVAARGNILMAATTAGLFRSIDTGANWTLASGTGGLPTGANADLVADPSNNSRFYISVRGASPQLLRSPDSGASWTNITAGVTGLSSSTSTIKFAVGPTGVVFVAVVNSGALAGVFRSPDQGATWTAMDVPTIHPGGQGGVNSAIAADPTDTNIVYVSGDRITASPFTGNVHRGDASLALGSQFVPIVDSNAGNTAPHADSRDLVFDGGGNLLETDDGGIYRRVSPRTNSGTWTSVIGNLTVMEIHDLDHDAVSNIAIAGTQDNGTHIVDTPGNLVWRFISGGDGGDVLADDRTLAPTSSFRYTSSQNWGGPARRTFSAANSQTGNTGLPGIGDAQFVTPIELSVASADRLMIGGASNMYEINNVTSGSPTLTTISTPGSNRGAVAHGVRADASAAYIGSGAAVFKRTGGGAFAATAALPAGAAAITDVAIDPDNVNIAFAVDDNQIFRTIDGGTSWTDVTGNIASISAFDFRTIEFMELQAGDQVAVGTRSGVYATPVNAATWSLFGQSLPNVLVFDLRFDATQQKLFAGTLGRGAFVLTVPMVIDSVFANSFE
ncbi:hypothetical protein C7S18_04655 [Ahniella affigens]|uniref:Sortilin N-terminal domain-containing protein n=1 Tax=Ahniella affigens TaxID=2021234 RepID=A0A2P1PNV9_9GAMM|nr:hypothetical protein [Ahniella affigens]AVP96532.1 hypothetical protein C7S18_04655 [Ahniella affigens]